MRKLQIYYSIGAEGGALDPNFWTYEFDYDLQQLQLKGTLTTTDPYDRDQLWVGMLGEVDSNTTFEIIMDITNNSGVPWTSYILQCEAGVGNFADIVDGTIQVTKFDTITYEEVHLPIEFSGPEPLLPGESFTIQFDCSVNYFEPGSPFFCNGFIHQPVPEPATVLLFALGAVMLRRKR